ncbi:MAG: FG-GAP repeat protein [Planctomycetes bacterium]|nr:FG-GAP repeat protein [Planctomycetota bacterium]
MRTAPFSIGSLATSWIAAIAAGRAGAQQEAWRALGTSSAPNVGTSVAFLGDVNGDGIPDYVAGGPALTLLPEGIGHVLIGSGADGSLLLDLAGVQGDGFGHAVANAGDLDGDAIPDLAIGASRDGKGVVFLHSGATGALLRSFGGSSGKSEFGTSLANLGDLDGDGFDEIAVGAPEHLVGGVRVGRATVHSGANGSVLASFVGATAGGKFGSIVADAGDVDADGARDLLVVEQADLSSGTASGTARIYSGATFSLLHQIGLGPMNRGWTASGAGDVNGDGIDDLIVGNDSYPVTQTGPSNFLYGGVWVYDGATHAVLHSFASFDFTGRAVSGAGDVDGDGLADFAFEYQQSGDDYCRVVSGGSGLTLADAKASSWVRALGAGTDVTGDGVPELVVGLPAENSGGIAAGAAWLLDPVTAKFPRKSFGTTRTDRLGRTSALLDDVDGDGVRDVLAGVGGAWATLGSARVLSGVDGAELRVHAGTTIDDAYAETVAALPDIDGDSIGEYAITVPGPQTGSAGLVEVRSGATGNLLQTLPPGGGGSGYFGASCAVVVQPSGAVELAVGCPNYGTAGAVFVYAVGTGANVVTAIGVGSSTGFDRGFGAAVAAMGDVDGDGTFDWAMGSPENDAVTLFSGSTGATIRTVVGTASTGFGASVCSVGDLDGDGVPDLFVGAPADGRAFRGKVHLHSGATGNLLRTWDGSTAFDELGKRLTPIGDVNRDGVGEVLMGARGTAWLRSGATGALLYRFDGAKNADFFGYSTAGVAAPGTSGSMNGDSIPDVAIGATNDTTNGASAGRLSLYYLDDLYLQIDPPVATAGVTVSATTSGGPSGKLAALYLVGIDGAPLFELLSLGSFDPEGLWPLSDVIPPGLGGHTYSLQAWAIGFNGKVISAQPTELEIQ